jgi:hypothetical protein
MLKIRLATHDDASAMMVVHREAVFSKAQAHYELATLEAWSAGPTPDRIARVEQEISNADFIVLVAEAGHQIIGFAMGVPSKNELRAVYVKHNPIGNVGSALLSEIEKRVFMAGAKFLTCDASLNAQVFYQNNGYTPEGPIDHVLANGVTVPCVRMKKTSLNMVLKG